MFEIHGFFNENDANYVSRLQRHLSSYTVQGNYRPDEEDTKLVPLYPDGRGRTLFDFESSFEEYEANGNLLRAVPGFHYALLPPYVPVCDYYAPLCDRIILSNKAQQLSHGPFLPLESLRTQLRLLSHLKDKILILLSASSFDYNLVKEERKALSNNQAILLAARKGANLFFDETCAASYFTYLDDDRAPHLVWVEDTRGLSVKHNLVKHKGFRGICWENTCVTADGNWEALSAVYQKAAADTAEVEAAQS